MKFIIYWVTYLSSLSPEAINISGRVVLDVDNKTISTFVHGVGYVDWQIDHLNYSVLQNTPGRRTDQIDRCRIIAHHDNIRLVLFINLQKVKMDLDCPEMGLHEHIEYNRKL